MRTVAVRRTLLTTCCNMSSSKAERSCSLRSSTRTNKELTLSLRRWHRSMLCPSSGRACHQRALRTLRKPKKKRTHPQRRQSSSLSSCVARTPTQTTGSTTLTRTRIRSRSLSRQPTNTNKGRSITEGLEHFYWLLSQKRVKNLTNLSTPAC